jgi:hypothetical protein
MDRIERIPKVGGDYCSTAICWLPQTMLSVRPSPVFCSSARSGALWHMHQARRTTPQYQVVNTWERGRPARNA